MGVILTFGIVLGGLRRYKKGIPLAGSCSAAISGACHRPDDDVNAAVLPVMWGAVSSENLTIGHCCFTSFNVSPPMEGKLYA